MVALRISPFTLSEKRQVPPGKHRNNPSQEIPRWMHFRSRDTGSAPAPLRRRRAMPMLCRCRWPRHPPEGYAIMRVQLSLSLPPFGLANSPRVQPKETFCAMRFRQLKSRITVQGLEPPIVLPPLWRPMRFRQAVLQSIGVTLARLLASRGRSELGRCSRKAPCRTSLSGVWGAFSLAPSWASRPARRTPRPDCHAT